MLIEPHEPARAKRKPLALVVNDPAPGERTAKVDWSSWYVTDEDDKGESVEQFSILWLLLSSLGRLAAERGWKNVMWAGDSFFGWVKDEPLVRVSPDAYLLDDPPGRPYPKSWQTWLPGHRPPRWAVEVVSEDWKKDYEGNPAKYAQLGTRELVIFDPEAPLEGASKVRVPLQVYRRGEDGAFVRTYRGDGPAWCEEIDAALVVQRDGGAVTLRIARDPDGKDIVPTAEEAHAAAEEARAAAAEATATAEARIRQLEAELAKLRGG